MSYTKSQMLYSEDDHYKWKATGNDNPNITHGSDSVLLNRREGYEVLHFINGIAKKLPDQTVETYRKLEHMIRYTVPQDIRSHKKITDWIFNNWN